MTNNFMVPQESAQIGGRSKVSGERGVALVTTLLLLSLVTVLGLVMFLSLSSDMLINGYYRNYRGSFYAADSGLNVAREDLVNQVNGSLPATFAVPPIPNPTTLADTAAAYVTTHYTNYTSANVGQAANSWVEQYKITNVTFVPANGSPVITSRDGITNNPTGYTYTFNYGLTSMGKSEGSEQSTISESGSIILAVSAANGANKVSFAAFGGFVDRYDHCLGPLVPGTMTGPMFTNNRWEFMTGGQYIFTDPVGQVDSQADWWVNWNCFSADSNSFTQWGQTIAPTFQGGFMRGQAPAPLPTNGFNQEQAVLDGLGLGPGGLALSSPPSNTALHNGLRDINGTQYPMAGASSGVYVAYDNSSGTNVIQGGGLYVEGDAQIVMSPVSGSSTAQSYVITNPASGGTTTTITTDPNGTPPAGMSCPGHSPSFITGSGSSMQTTVMGTTVIQSGGVTTTICGVPMNNVTNAVHTASRPGTMLYVNGPITISGDPSQGGVAVQDHAQITITAATGDITAKGNVMYKHEPVTFSQNQIPGTPIDTLIPGNDFDQVLGFYAPNGNFVTYVNNDWDNIQVDGTIAVFGPYGTSGGFLNTGACVDTFNNMGGQVQQNIYGACMATQNIFFDRRYTNKQDFAPPWFPQTTVSFGQPLPINVVTSVQRVQWVNQTTLQ